MVRPDMIEQEVKLQFPHVEAARQAISAAGGRLVQSSRLIEDRLFDTSDASLRQAGKTVRVRRDGGTTLITVKGPLQPGVVKSREELETRVDSAAVIEGVLGGLGFHQVFKAQKYREEYELDRAHVTIDQAPVGVFVEIEATPERIEAVTRLLGRTPADYLLDSYPMLWRQWCAAHNRPYDDMLFPETEVR